MAYSELSIALIRSGKAVMWTLFDLVRTNFNDHETRIAASEIAFGNIPAGIILPYGKSTAPADFLFCDGSVVSQATYAALYAVIGSTFNTGGEGAGNFRLPDPRGRAPIAAGTGTGLTARAVGTQLGVETHPLVTAELPVHNHTVNDSGHTHTWPKVTSGGGVGTAEETDTNGFTALSTQSKTTGMSAGNTGSGTAHQNMAPSFVTGFIIKT